MQRALTYAEELGLLSGLVGDFSTSKTVLGNIWKFDYIGLRRTHCKHTKDALDANCACPLSHHHHHHHLIGG